MMIRINLLPTRAVKKLSQSQPARSREGPLARPSYRLEEPGGHRVRQEAAGRLGVATLDRALQALGLGKTIQGDVYRALKFLRVPVQDVGVDASFGCLIDPGLVEVAEDRDHGTVGLAHDLRDELECMVGILAEAYDRDVGELARCYGRDFRHRYRAADHVMAHVLYDGGQQLKPIVFLVGDKNPKTLQEIHRLP